MNFVDMFLKYTEDAESPTSYFRWAAYTTLAATMRDNVWVDLVLTKIYPNMYTIILSRRSSMTKKSTPLKTSLSLLDAVRNTKVVNGRATIAGIINVLTSPQTNNEGQHLSGASAILYSEEISSLLIEDAYATDTLTDWYDGHKRWTSSLGPGAITIENLCLSVLASSNEELIRTVFSSRATQGGLLARSILIAESKKRKKNSLMFVQPKGDTDTHLIAHLKKVAFMKGPMEMEHDAKVYYDDWYNNFEPLEENSSKTGIEGRLHIHALKLAMVKSAAERYDRIITKKHVEEAITECLDILPNYGQFAGGSSGPLEKLGRELIMVLLESNNYQIKKQEVMWRFWGAGSQTINNVIEALTEAGTILPCTDAEGSFCLRLTVDFLDRLQRAHTNGNH